MAYDWNRAHWLVSHTLWNFPATIVIAVPESTTLRLENEQLTFAANLDLGLNMEKSSVSHALKQKVLGVAAARAARRNNKAKYEGKFGNAAWSSPSSENRTL